MNQYILDAIDQKAIDTELETSFTMMEYYMKRMRMESCLDTSIEEVYQEADRSLKEMWDSDTSAIHGREGEGAFWRVVKFLPRLIRNIVKWIVSHIKALFNKEKKADKARKVIANSDVSEEEFVQAYNDAKPETPSKKEKYTSPELSIEETPSKKTPSEKAPYYLDKKQQYESPDTPPKNTHSALSELKGFCENMKKWKNITITPEKIYQNIFKNRLVFSTMDINFTSNMVDTISNIVEDILKIENDLGNEKSSQSSKNKMVYNQLKELTQKLEPFANAYIPGNKYHDESMKIKFSGCYFYDNSTYNNFRNSYISKIDDVAKKLKTLVDSSYLKHDTNMGKQKSDYHHEIRTIEKETEKKLQKKGTSQGDINDALDEKRKNALHSKTKNPNVYQLDDVLFDVGIALQRTHDTLQTIRNNFYYSEDTTENLAKWCLSLNKKTRVQ